MSTPTDRRSFLARLAAVAAGGTVVSQLVAEPTETPATLLNYRVGPAGYLEVWTTGGVVRLPYYAE